MANLLATIVGIAIGLPVALWVDRLGRKKDEETTKMEAKRRAHKLLTLLEVELNNNCEMMNKFHKDVSNNFYPVSDETWKALSEGGEIECLEDPEIVYEISKAYARIGQFEYLFKKYVDAYFYPGSSTRLIIMEPVLELTLRARDTAVSQATIARNFIVGKIKVLKVELSIPDSEKTN
jgi:hypothetical protein